MPVNRRAQVMTSAAILTLKMRDTFFGNAGKPPRPVWGGITAGLHYQPVPLKDSILALVEEHNWTSVAMPAVTKAQTTTVMQPGEVGFLYADGTKVCYLYTTHAVDFYNRSGGALGQVTSSGAWLFQAASGQTCTLQGGATQTILLDGSGDVTLTALSGTTITLTAGSSGIVNVISPTTLQSSLSFPATTPAPTVVSTAAGWSSVAFGAGSNGQRGSVHATLATTLTAPMQGALPVATISLASLFGSTTPFLFVSLGVEPVYPIVGVYAVPSGPVGEWTIGLTLAPMAFTWQPTSTQTSVVTSAGAGTTSFWAASSSGASTTVQYAANFGFSSSSSFLTYLSAIVQEIFSLSSGLVVTVNYWAVG